MLWLLLTAAILIAYTLEDLNSSTSLPQSTPTDQNHKVDDSDDDDTTKNQEVTSLVFKVLTHPSYPDYIPCQKRLESFVDWQYNSIHTPESLAHAGFFYAGYADCVRCFHCGLGLRSWKPGDNIDDQHKKHRPNCTFLQAQKKDEKTHVTSNESLHPKPTENNGLSLLERENEKLKHQMSCKVFSKAPIKDLFLPCGERFACTDFLNLKPIAKNRNVYFSSRSGYFKKRFR